jgi:hypothetical protein
MRVTYKRAWHDCAVQTKKRLGWTSRMHGQMSMSDILNSEECLEDLGIDGRITMKQLLQKYLLCGLGLVGGRQKKW